MIVGISGGTGFIGSCLARTFIRQGAEVRVLSRNKASEKLPKEVKIFQTDLESNTNNLEEFFEDMDIFYHCASENSNEERMRRVNIEGTKKLLLYGGKKVKKWVQLSSVGVYGHLDRTEVDEDLIEYPSNCYEKSKFLADRCLREYAVREGLNHCIIRPSIVIGSEMKSLFIKHIVKMVRSNLFFYVNSRQSIANLIFLDDLVDVLVLVGIKKESDGRLYNLSDCITYKEIVEIIKTVCNYKRFEVTIPRQILYPFAFGFGNIKRFPLNLFRLRVLSNKTTFPINKLKDELGYEIKVGIREGLKFTLQEWKYAQRDLMLQQPENKTIPKTAFLSKKKKHQTTRAFDN